MSKIVIEFEQSPNGNKDDLILYDNFQKKWVQVSKQSFLKDIMKVIKNQSQEIEQLKKENSIVKKDISTIAKILQGEIK